MSVQENIRLDEEWIAACNAGDVDRALAVQSDDIVCRFSPSTSLRGKEALRSFVQGVFVTYPDCEYTVTNRVVTDDQLADEITCVWTGTGQSTESPGAPPAHRKLSSKVAQFLRIRNGKIAELNWYEINLPQSG